MCPLSMADRTALSYSSSARICAICLMRSFSAAASATRSDPSFIKAPSNSFPGFFCFAFFTKEDISEDTFLASETLENCIFSYSPLLNFKYTESFEDKKELEAISTSTISLRGIFFFYDEKKPDDTIFRLVSSISMVLVFPLKIFTIAKPPRVTSVKEKTKKQTRMMQLGYLRLPSAFLCYQFQRKLSI